VKTIDEMLQILKGLPNRLEVCYESGYLYGHRPVARAGWQSAERNVRRRLVQAGWEAVQIPTPRYSLQLLGREGDGRPEKPEGKVLYTFKADPIKNPKQIDLVLEVDKKEVVLRGFYREAKDRRIICVGLASGNREVAVVEGQRPTGFKSGPQVQPLTFEQSGR